MPAARALPPRAKFHLESSCHLDRLSAPECLIGLKNQTCSRPVPASVDSGLARPPQPCTDMEKNGKRSLEMIVDARVQGQGRRVSKWASGGFCAVTFRRSGYGS